jgi:hypothetical protein
MKRSELTSGSELQRSALNNILTKQEGNKTGLEKTVAPSDYHLFLHIKKFLAGQSLRYYQDTKTRSAGLAERLGGELFRRSHTKAGPTIPKNLNLHGD